MSMGHCCFAGCTSVTCPRCKERHCTRDFHVCEYVEPEPVETANVVVGKRSPRWAFMSKLRIPCSGGLVYLVRLRIIDTPWFGVYLHDIREPDHDYDPHDHPWPFTSIILWGGYTERVYDLYHRFPDPEKSMCSERGADLTWGLFSRHKMGQWSAHRITSVKPHSVSLILRGKRNGSWGFHTDEGWVEWDVYKKVNG